MALGRVGAMDSLEMINGEDVLKNIGENCRLFAWREPSIYRPSHLLATSKAFKPPHNPSSFLSGPPSLFWRLFSQYLSRPTRGWGRAKNLHMEHTYGNIEGSIDGCTGGWNLAPVFYGTCSPVRKL